MNTSRISRYTRAIAVACASVAMIGTAQAQGHGGGHGFGGGGFSHGGGGFHGGGHPGGYYHGRGGWGWGGVGVGIGLGVGLGLAGYYGAPWYYGDPAYVVADPGVTYVQSQPVPATAGAVDPNYAPQPVIYPRNGQSAAQMEADSNACSEWAGKQPNATADPNVFRRGITACMDARGYTLR